jgi:tryptophan synthase alpha subunit
MGLCIIFRCLVSRVPNRPKQTSLGDDVKKLRKATSLPVCVGFGIKTPDQAKEVAAIADGVVVGSALVDVIGKAADPKQAVRDVSSLVTSFATAIRSVKKPQGKASAA